MSDKKVKRIDASWHVSGPKWLNMPYFYARRCTRVKHRVGAQLRERRWDGATGPVLSSRGRAKGSA